MCLTRCAHMCKTQRDLFRPPNRVRVAKKQITANDIPSSNSFCVTYVMEISKYQVFRFIVLYSLLPPVALQYKCKYSDKYIYISYLPSYSSYTNMFWYNNKYKKTKTKIAYISILSEF